MGGYILFRLAFSSAVILLSGCASIFNGSSQAVVFQSEPAGASITVTNRAGEKVHTGTTPVTVTLKRGYGYFKSEMYTVGFEKPGFAKKEIVITGTMSGWYIGNILLGGIIGMLAVDPVTGAMYVFPETVNAPLEAASSSTANAGMSLNIVTIQSLSPEQMARASLVAQLK